MMGSTSNRVVVYIALTWLQLHACTSEEDLHDSRSAQAERDQYLRVSSEGVLVDGATQFRMKGFNIFGLAHLSDAQLEATLTTLSQTCGANIVRFFGTKYLVGYWGDVHEVSNQQAIDDIRRVIDASKRVAAALKSKGVAYTPRFIITLHDFPTNMCFDPDNGAYRCSEGADDEAKNAFAQHREDVRKWFEGDYRSRWGFDFERYVYDITGAFKDEPSIAVWEVMNEPHLWRRHCADDPKELCDDAQPWADALIGFMAQITGVIRRADPNHLIATGMMNTRYPLAGERFSVSPFVSSNDFYRINALDTVDLVSMHYYEYDDAPDPLTITITQEKVFFATRYLTESQRPKPVYFGELGFPMVVCDRQGGVDDANKPGCTFENDRALQQKFAVFADTLLSVQSENRAEAGGIVWSMTAGNNGTPTRDSAGLENDALCAALNTLH